MKLFRCHVETDPTSTRAGGESDRIFRLDRIETVDIWPCGTLDVLLAGGERFIVRGPDAERLRSALAVDGCAV